MSFITNKADIRECGLYCLAKELHSIQTQNSAELTTQRQAAGPHPGGAVSSPKKKGREDIMRHKFSFETHQSY